MPFAAYGQRVTKRGSGVVTGGTHYVYDDEGHLLGEYDVGGAFLKEYLWLGHTPVAVVSPGGTAGSVEIHYLHSDQLNSPRAVVSPGGVLRWRWDGEPFGATAANADADADGTAYEFNLRFPGQYFDKETGLHYNYFRDYDPNTGRYIQADPIGLAGGSMSLYTYADNAPTMKTDPLGLMGNAPGRGPYAPGTGPGTIPGQGYAGAAGDFLRNYRDMRDANTIGADKYFHCKANCEAAQRGKQGQQIACLISDGREWFDQNIKGDPASASAADQAANQFGRNQGANSSLSCSQFCAPLRPNGLPASY